jgi:hypothetical protein
MKKSNRVQSLPRLSEEDLAKSARVAREDCNRFGLLFREMQLEALQSILERQESATHAEGAIELGPRQ